MSKASSNSIIVYTDGAARGNPGPGGYGIVMISGNHRKEFSQGYSHTTNNRMELLAVIVALEKLRFPGSEVTVYSDSKYVCEAVNQGWLLDWEKKRFKKKKNPDLWIRFLGIYRQHRVKLVWIKGHNNIQENEVCDRLAVDASKQKKLLTDEGYEQDDEIF